MTTSDEAAPETLQALVTRHLARYEVHPHREFASEQMARVGFELHLYGLPESTAGLAPGCAECLEVYEALREAAEWTLPREHRP